MTDDRRDPPSVDAQDVATALSSMLGPARNVCVHARLSSFGHVVGGADGVVDGVLATGATLVVPTFSTWAFSAPPPAGRRLARNAEDDGSIPESLPERGYSPECVDVNTNMGAVPAAVLHREDHQRGAHPLNSFAAVGPDAAALVGGQRPLAVYAPLEELVARRGWVVAMGVGLDSVTLVHLAESVAGARLFRRWALLADGTVEECEIGSCSRGFERLAPHVAGIEVPDVVGRSTWRAWPAADLLEIAVGVLLDDREALRCDNPRCPRCRDLVAGGPIG